MNVLVVITAAAGARARDGLDAALAALAFEHRLSLLLLGDGVSALAPDQRPAAHGQADIGRGVAALAHHGAEAIAADAAALAARGIAAPAGVRVLGADEIAPWIAEHRHVFRF
jgi:sulfur relay (sulfurtransferase) DsrF/TusC family protein